MHERRVWGRKTRVGRNSRWPSGDTDATRSTANTPAHRKVLGTMSYSHRLTRERFATTTNIANTCCGRRNAIQREENISNPEAPAISPEQGCPARGRLLCPIGQSLKRCTPRSGVRAERGLVLESGFSKLRQARGQDQLKRVGAAVQYWTHRSARQMRPRRSPHGRDPQNPPMDIRSRQTSTDRRATRSKLPGPA